MDYLDKRAQVICNDLKKLSIRNITPMTDWQYKPGEFVTCDEADKAKPAFKTFDAKTMHWHGPDAHFWFTCEVDIPSEYKNEALWMHISTQIEEWDDGRNPQFLLFIDGVPVQGIDMNHRDVKLWEATKGKKHVRLDLQAYTGTLHDEFSLKTYFFLRDEEITALYYDIQVPLWSFSRKDPEDRDRIALMKVINDTVNLLDMRDPYSKEFYASIKEASKYIQKELYTNLAGHNEVIASCIGHTHIDVAWWWTVAQVRQKVCRSFATVLKLMDEYPSYKFMSSQPQLYQFLKARYPVLYDQIKKRIEEGRWEVEGGAWLEPDTNLPSGESLVRQFMHGRAFFREEFGKENYVLWLPDVFGYTGALPQIMKQCGIKYFQTTKISWNQVDKFPYDTMIWRGIDGSEVFSHMCTTPGVGQDVKKEFFTTYNAMLHPDSVIGAWDRYQQKKLNNDVLISYGYGDGGGGPTREMLEVSKRLEKGIVGTPKVEQKFVGKYFKDLEKRVKDNKDLPLWEGEIYFEYHRGTLTSMGRNKRANRKSELLLMDLELLASLALMYGLDKNYPKEDLHAMWENVLLNQFHDILPGSAIHEVYEVTKKEYEHIENLGISLRNKSMKALAGSGDHLTVFNTVGYKRNDYLVLDKDVKAKALKDSDGNVYPIQNGKEESIVYLENLPSKGYKSYELVNKEEKIENKLKITDAGIETPFLKIKIDKDGLFTSIYDKENKREVLKKGMRGNLIKMFEDKPIYYDDWDIDYYYQEKSWDVTNVSKMKWIEVGPLRATLYIERKISKSLIKQKIYFYANNRRIDFDTYVDYKNSQHLLKVFFPLDIHSDEALFDIQFGNIKRKTTYNTSWDLARFESCGQRFVDYSEGNYGAAVLNDCKYGHSIKDGVIGLSLIKAGIEPNPTCDIDEHYFTYSFLPHSGPFAGSDVQKQAISLNQPLLAIKGGKACKEFSLLDVDADNIEVQTIKRSEDGSGYIVRMFEFENSRTNFKFNWHGPEVAEIYETNCVEEEKGKKLKVVDGSFSDQIYPFEIKTYFIKLK